MKKIEVTLIKSLIGRLPRQVKTAQSMGLYKIHDVRVLNADEAVLGKVNAISHLVSVKEL